MYQNPETNCETLAPEFRDLDLDPRIKVPPGTPINDASEILIPELRESEIVYKRKKLKIRERYSLSYAAGSRQVVEWNQYDGEIITVYVVSTRHEREVVLNSTAKLEPLCFSECHYI